MARLNNVQRIIVEDFKDDQRDMASKLANVLNYFMTQVTDIVNGRIDYTNINKQLVTLDVTVDSSGTPIQTSNFTAQTGLIGGIVIKSQNLTNTAVYPTSQPHVTFSQTQSGLYKVNNISGLQANNRYLLYFEVTY